VDAAARGEPPGTVTVLEVEVPDPATLTGPVMDAHDLTPDAIFALLASLGGRPRRCLVVACEPADVSAGMGLSEPVRAALPHAVRTVEEILASVAGARPRRAVSRMKWERSCSPRQYSPRQCSRDRDV
jgi:hydrogenase maturation protease